MSIILETKSITKSFGGLMAVNRVDFNVPAGEIRGLIGPNGSGKTTLLNLITGVYDVDSGQVFLQGKKINKLSPNRIAKEGLLRTFQVPKLFGSMSVIDNMLVPHFARANPFTGGKIDDATQQVNDLLALADLTHLRDAPAQFLSGGQKALLQIMRGFMVKNLKVFFLDEPFAGVNPVIKEAINKLILAKNQEDGITFIVISHEMEQIRQLCHRITALAEGSVIAEDTMEEIAENQTVIEAYLGKGGSI